MSCCYKSPYKKVTHVIFDLDGTILDSEPIYDTVFAELAEEYGKKITEEISNKIHGSTQARSLEIFCENLKIDVDKEEITEKFITKAYAKIPSAPLTKGAEEIIRHIASYNIPLAIATSSSRDEFELKTAAHSELFDIFHHVVCGDDPEVYKSKPNPAIFLAAAKRFKKNPDPEECLVFEDSPNGVRAGIRAGMQVVMIPATSVRYSDWQVATIRIDSLDLTPLELFGLPALRTPLPNPCFDGVVIKEISLPETTEQKNGPNLVGEAQMEPTFQDVRQSEDSARLLNFADEQKAEE